MVLFLSLGVSRHLYCFYFWIFAQHHSSVSKELGFLIKLRHTKGLRGGGRPPSPGWKFLIMITIEAWALRETEQRARDWGGP